MRQIGVETDPKLRMGQCRTLCANALQIREVGFKWDEKDLATFVAEIGPMFEQIKDQKTRRWLAAAVHHLAAEKVKPLLETLAADTDPSVSRSAKRALDRLRWAKNVTAD